MQIKSAVVTGATSFIGVNLIRKLLERKIRVYAVVRPGSKNMTRLPSSNTELQIIEKDLTDYQGLSKLIHTSPEAFFHLAWEGARGEKRLDDDLQYQNYLGALAAADEAVRMGCRIFIGSGSQAEYGKQNRPADENYPAGFDSAYGKWKHKAYLDIAPRMRQAGIRFIWTRIFSVYGIYDYPGTLVMSCLNKMLKNQPIDMTECSQKWNFLYVEDAAEAFIRFAESEAGSGDYNVASRDNRTLREFVEEIQKVTVSESTLNFGAIPYGPSGPSGFEPVVTKMEKALQWKPATEFHTGIRKMLDFIQDETTE